MDRESIRHRLRRPVRTDRVVPSPGARISQTQCHRANSTKKQRAFIRARKLLNSLGDDGAMLFADAVHPTHAARPVGCWAPSQEKLAIEQTSGRQRIDSRRDRPGDRANPDDRGPDHRRRLDDQAAAIDRGALSDAGAHPCFLGQRGYRHAKLVQEWLALPGRRIKLHFIQTYCPHLNPIERLWGLIRNVTHNKCYATCAQFADAALSFLREKVPGNWADLCVSVTDNFRIINPKDFRVYDVNGVYQNPEWTI